MKLNSKSKKKSCTVYWKGKSTLQIDSDQKILKRDVSIKILVRNGQGFELCLFAGDVVPVGSSCPN